MPCNVDDGGLSVDLVSCGTMMGMRGIFLEMIREALMTNRLVRRFVHGEFVKLPPKDQSTDASHGKSDGQH